MSRASLADSDYKPRAHAVESTDVPRSRAVRRSTHAGPRTGLFRPRPFSPSGRQLGRGAGGFRSRPFEGSVECAISLVLRIVPRRRRASIPGIVGTLQLRCQARVLQPRHVSESCSSPLVLWVQDRRRPFPAARSDDRPRPHRDRERAAQPWAAQSASSRLPASRSSTQSLVRDGADGFRAPGWISRCLIRFSAATPRAPWLRMGESVSMPATRNRGSLSGQCDQEAPEEDAQTQAAQTSQAAASQAQALRPSTPGPGCGIRAPFPESLPADPITSPTCSDVFLRDRAACVCSSLLVQCLSTQKP